MADPYTTQSNSSMTAVVSIVAILLIAIIAYFAFFRSHSPGIPNTGGQNVEVNTGASSPTAPADQSGGTGGGSTLYGS